MEIPGLEADVFFGDAETQTPDWRETLPEEDDDAEPSEEDIQATIGILGFDPRESEQPEKPVVRPSPFEKKSYQVKGSYFADCERDDTGHCLPSGEADEGESEPDETLEDPHESKKEKINSITLESVEENADHLRALHPNNAKGNDADIAKAYVPALVEHFKQSYQANLIGSLKEAGVPERELAKVQAAVDKGLAKVSRAGDKYVSAAVKYSAAYSAIETFDEVPEPDRPLETDSEGAWDKYSEDEAKYERNQEKLELLKEKEEMASSAMTEALGHFDETVEERESMIEDKLEEAKGNAIYRLDYPEAPTVGKSPFEKTNEP